MSARHPLPLLLLSVVFLSCRQDAPTSADTGELGLSASHMAGAALVVDDDGADCPDAQFTGIQAAVDAAAPGDRILVCNGTYREQVTVSKHDLSIHAAGERGDVVVHVPHGFNFGFRVLSASGVTIQGFRVEHAHEADIALHGATATTVRGNVTTAAGHDGIQLVNAHDNLIEHNVVFDNPAGNACGVNVTGGSQRNVVRHNRLVNNEWGIQIAGATTRDNVIEKNMSLGNRGNGIRNVGGASGTIIAENHAVRNGFTPSAATGATNAGIRIMSGTGIVVRGNHAADNRLVDLLNEAGTGATFEDNRCDTSSPGGLCERGRP